MIATVLPARLRWRSEATRQTDENARLLWRRKMVNESKTSLSPTEIRAGLDLGGHRVYKQLTAHNRKRPRAVMPGNQAAKKHGVQR
jgi:hypothetical protein